MPFPTDTDPDLELEALIAEEQRRQVTGLQLIASENFTSPAVMRAVGSVLTNKYSEGYPGKRYYGGNEVIDSIEALAIERVKELFGADHANVQPHSGANANMCVYQALLSPGDTVLGLGLDHFWLYRGVHNHPLVLVVKPGQAAPPRLWSCEWFRFSLRSRSPRWRRQR